MNDVYGDDDHSTNPLRNEVGLTIAMPVVYNLDEYACIVHSALLALAPSICQYWRRHRTS